MKDNLFPQIGPHFPDKEGEPLNLTSERARMKATCKVCKREIEVEGWAPMTEGYICAECQARFEGSFFRHLIQKRIERKEIVKDES